MPHKNTIGTNGFTIAELIVTLVVLSTAFIVFSTLFTTINNTAERALDYTHANEAAFTKMQEYENAEFSTVLGLTNTDGSETEIEDFTSEVDPEVLEPDATVYATRISDTLLLIKTHVTFREINSLRDIEYANYIHVSGAAQ